MVLSNKPTAGLLLVSHIREPSYLAEKVIEEGIKILEKEGLKIFYPGKSLKNEEMIRNAIETFKAKKIDVIIVVIGNWIEPPVIVHPLQDINSLPLIIWALPETKELMSKNLYFGSLSGAAVVKSALEQMNWNFKFVVCAPDEDRGIKEIVNYSKAALVRQKLRACRVGLIGYQAMGIYTTSFDQLGLKRTLGTEIDSMDTYILIEEMKKITQQKSDIIEEKLTETCQIKEEIIKNGSLSLSIKMYLALKKLKKEQGWCALSVKCQHELTTYLRCSACLPLSLLTDEGIMCSCEGDIHGVLTMLMEHLLCDLPVFFGDIFLVKNDNLIACHCGIAPHNLREEGTKVILSPQNPRISKDGKTTGGVVSSLIFQKGKVTLARLEGRGSYYKMHIVTGNAEPTDTIAFGYSTMKITLDTDQEDFIEKLLANHYAIAYSDIKNELIEVCKILGIEVI